MNKREQMEAQAEADWAAHAGKILLVTAVEGYNDHDDSVTVTLDPPARMRVSGHPDDINSNRTLQEDVAHWCDNWLDPYWDVDLVEPHPALVGIRSMWVYGPSYCTDGNIEPSSDWELEQTGVIQKLRDWTRGVLTKETK